MRCQSGCLEAWTRQQLNMALRVVRSDNVPWRLDAEQSVEQLSQLERVGGLDISFVEAHPSTGPPGTATVAAAVPGTDPPAAATPEAGAREPNSQAVTGDTGGDPTKGPGEPVGPGVAALVVVSFPDMRVLFEDYEPVDLSIPYLPGFLGFRECDAYIRLLRRVEGSPHRPQVLLVDGCGVLHPRGCGSACQVGVTCDYPSVGVAKNLLAVDGLDRFVVRRQLQEAAAAAARGAAAAAAEGSGRGSTTQQQAAVAPGATERTGRDTASSSQSAAAAAVRSAAAATTSAKAASSRPPDCPDPWDGAHSSTADMVTSSVESGTGRGTTTTRGSGAAATACAAGRGGGGGGAAAAAADTVRDVQVSLVGRSGAVHGVALCPGLSRRPLFVSVGHRLSLETAVELVRRCCVHRVPEPIRQADLRSRQWLRDRVGAAAAAEAAASTSMGKS